MCFADRNTTSRGRSAEPDTLCRTRRCRWCRRSGRVRTLWIDRMGLLGRLGGLAGLTPDLPPPVTDPLPLVSPRGPGRAHHPTDLPPGPLADASVPPLHGTVAR